MSLQVQESPAAQQVTKEGPRVSDMVVVESGPVEYEKASEETGTRLNAAGEEEEDEEFFDEDELEEEPVSAAQLMGIDNEGNGITLLENGRGPYSRSEAEADHRVGYHKLISVKCNNCFIRYQILD